MCVCVFVCLANERSSAELKKMQRKERKAALKAQAKALEEKKGEGGKGRGREMREVGVMCPFTHS